jgi:hypothetical protein
MEQVDTQLGIPCPSLQSHHWPEDAGYEISSSLSEELSNAIEMATSLHMFRANPSLFDFYNNCKYRRCCRPSLVIVVVMVIEMRWCCDTLIVPTDGDLPLFSPYW